MNNILLLTSLYPSEDYSTNTTPVVHSFAKEWVKLGYNVVVVHNENKFLLPFYYLPKQLLKSIESKFGVRIPSIKQRKDEKFILDGVKVFKFPILKIIPFGKFFRFQINRQINRIASLCNNLDFKPDIILGHWEYPQIEIIPKLKIIYPHSKSCVVFHGLHYILRDKNLLSSLKTYDFVGFRSIGLQKRFEQVFGYNYKTFLCYSGIPDEYVDRKIEEKQFIAGKVCNFIFVGLLIKRKFPNIILDALLKSNLKDFFKLVFVGDGPLEKQIKRTAILNNVHNRVSYFNKISRIDVLTQLESSQCFIMISKDEAFGLVYLEAMLCGCIVLASKNEGMDGIIVDGNNGFLLTAGNEQQLISVIEKINTLSAEELFEISNNAISSIKNLTDSKVALNYLENIQILN